LAGVVREGAVEAQRLFRHFAGCGAMLVLNVTEC
jgi:hypothetical protein